jgi:hypothetical protein
VKARDGVRDRIECGEGQDKVAADPFDLVSGCESSGRLARRAPATMR